ncbi:PREDICTED: F-box protein CPR30-like [Nicotiana attenuata]|uniref:F-box protein cpr30 n=1 Tax=Nicotiana attenuata TaxID=49451 RepID=A0A1J6ILT9_NICAT|nr:PREDICTED: F-box protein CPR30-like [Nicotiana attenuata]OIT01488.1 f-box protein cpr30 [Nicotiana attenuata]
MEGFSSNFDQIPEDIIMEIFSRLPVKSLLKLKSVCKFWYILIQTPTFITKHFSHKTNHAIPFIHLYFLDKKQLSFSNNEYPLFQDIYIHKSTSLKPVIGPLNGLFFVYNLDMNEMAIWNPATKEIKKIIIQSPPFYPYFKSYAHHFGFGIDPLSKDYKVIWIRDYWKEETFTRNKSAIISVYTLSTNSWKHFEDNTFWSSHIVMSYFGTYLDGFYYWQMITSEQQQHTQCINGGRKCDILAFDLTNEVFQVIKTPNLFNSNLGTLGLYDGFVSMFFHFVVQGKTCIEIWVMEKFGFWTKRLVIESNLIVKRPIGYGVNGEIFVETATSNLAMIDPTTQEIIKCIGPWENGYPLQVLVYKKSLVSIKKLSSGYLGKL